MATGTIRKTKNGYDIYHKDICVRVDNETISEVQEMARKAKKTFSAVIRALIEIGLETEKLEQTGKSS